MKKFRCYALGLLLLTGSLTGQAQNLYEISEYSNLLYLNESAVQNDSLQRLNLVIPKKQTKPPLLIWIGGGAWSYVDRNMEMALARKLAQRGIH